MESTQATQESTGLEQCHVYFWAVRPAFPIITAKNEYVSDLRSLNLKILAPPEESLRVDKIGSGGK